MDLSPRLYHRIIRPKWFTRRYIHDHITNQFTLSGKRVLDFGSGTGANCCLTEPGQYMGIEPDSGRVEFSQELYPDYDFRVFDMERVPAEDNSIDVVLTLAVLHHIRSDQIEGYLEEFRRILKPDGMVIAIEPCLCPKKWWCNKFMQWYDSGDYIRPEPEYLQLFEKGKYECEVLKRFTKCFLYNELFFSAKPV